MMDRAGYLGMLADYNAAVTAAVEGAMERISSQTELSQIVEEAGREWENREFGSGLPGEHFQGIREEDLWGIFDEACRILDDTFPPSLLAALMEEGSRERLAGKALDFSNPETSVAALRVLGMTRDTSHLRGIIAAILGTGEEEELIKETARQALVDMGKEAVPEILSALEGKESCNGDDFHLVIALLGILRQGKDEDVYRALKDVFRKTGEKGIAAGCLAEYGDPRAIPMLRAFLGKNLAGLDRETILEIKNAVEVLGGQVEDLLAGRPSG